MSVNYYEITQGLFSVEIRGFLFFAIALVGVFLLRKRSASVVATCWRSVFAASLILLLMSFAKPMLVMELLGSLEDQKEQKIASLLTPARETTAAEAVSRGSAGSIAEEKALKVGAEKSSHGGVQVSWRAVILAIWLSGMIVLLLRPLVGIFALAKLCRESQLGESILIENFKNACLCSGVRGLRLRVLPDLEAVPFVAGMLHPVFYVPSTASDWDCADWEIILRHEAAHVRHFDGLFNLIAQVSLAAYWVNPFAWIAYRQLKIAQECAADDSVICGGVNSNDYANKLLEFCGKAVVLPRMALPIARPSTMRVRIERILDTGRRRRPNRKESRSGAVALVILAAILGTTVFVRAEKAANQALISWTLKNLIEAIKEPQEIAREDALRFNPNRGGWAERYNRWGGILNLSFLEENLQHELYLTGPHENGKFMTKSQTSFGHYNPAALDEISEVVEGVLAHPEFVEEFQPVYDEHLREALRIHLSSYQKLIRMIEDDPQGFQDLSVEYQSWIADPQPGFEASLGDDYNHAVASSEKVISPRWYETCRNAKFWTRRMLDGTDKEFFQILMNVMLVMDPEAFSKEEGIKKK